MSVYIWSKGSAGSDSETQWKLDGAGGLIVLPATGAICDCNGQDVTIGGTKIGTPDVGMNSGYSWDLLNSGGTGKFIIAGDLYGYVRVRAGCTLDGSAANITYCVLDIYGTFTPYQETTYGLTNIYGSFSPRGTCVIYGNIRIKSGGTLTNTSDFLQYSYMFLEKGSKATMHDYGTLSSGVVVVENSSLFVSQVASVLNAVWFEYNGGHIDQSGNTAVTAVVMNIPYYYKKPTEVLNSSVLNKAIRFEERGQYDAISVGLKKGRGIATELKSYD